MLTWPPMQFSTVVCPLKSIASPARHLSCAGNRWVRDRDHHSFESTTGYIFTPCVGYFTSPGIYMKLWQVEGTKARAFSVSSKRHGQSGVNKIAQVLKQQQVVLNSDPLGREIVYNCTIVYCILFSIMCYIVWILP